MTNQKEKLLVGISIGSITVSATCLTLCACMLKKQKEDNQKIRNTVNMSNQILTEAKNEIRIGNEAIQYGNKILKDLMTVDTH